MRIDFRQGIISYPTAGNLQTFLVVSGNSVSLRAAVTPVQIAFAHGDADYLFTESEDVNNAWSRLPPTTKCWLYWDINTLTGQRTFGYTDRQPIVAATPPSSAAVGQMVFDLSTNTMYQYVAPTVRKPVIRVFACAIQGTTILPLGSGFPQKPFAGTQVGLNVPGAPGQIITDQSGTPIRLGGGVFMTTEDDLFVKGSAVNPVRIDATVVTAAAAETVARYQVVKFSNFGEVQLASYDDIEETAIAMAMEDILTQQTGTVCLQGKITNPAWNWTTVGAKLWVSEAGLLTETDPHVANAFVFPVGKAPVGRVISRDTIIFDQGLGGKGERGAPGASSGIEKATEVVYGIVRLSVPTEVAGDPVVVGSNDPRLSDKVLRSGDTMTGPLILSGSPTTDLQAATKQYVDSRSLNDLTDVNSVGAVNGNALVYNGTAWIPGTVEAGVDALYELSDVADSVATPATGQVLQYNGTLWTAQDLPPPPVVPSVLNDLGDVDATPVENDVLTFNGTEWVAAPVAGSGNPFDQDLNTFNDVRFNTMKADTSVLTDVVDSQSSFYVNVDTMNKNSWVTTVSQTSGSANVDLIGVANVNSSPSVIHAAPAADRGFYVHRFNESGYYTDLQGYATNSGTGTPVAQAIAVDSFSATYVTFNTTSQVTDPGRPAGIAKWDGNFDPGTSGFAWRILLQQAGSYPIVYPSQLSLTSIDGPVRDVIVTGTHTITESGDGVNRVFALKIDGATGDVIWHAGVSLPALPNSDPAVVTGQHIDANGDITLTVTYTSVIALERAVDVIKLNGANGDVIFAKSITFPTGVQSVGCVTLDSGNVVAVYKTDEAYCMLTLDGATGADIDNVSILPTSYNTSEAVTINDITTDGMRIIASGGGPTFGITDSVVGIYTMVIDPVDGIVNHNALLSYAPNLDIRPYGPTASGKPLSTHGGFAYVTGQLYNTDTNTYIGLVAAVDPTVEYPSDSTDQFLYTDVNGYLSAPSTPAVSIEVSTATNVVPALSVVTASTYVSRTYPSYSDFNVTTDTLLVGGVISWSFSPYGIETPNYSLPFEDGAENQTLITDGAGEVRWGSPDAPFVCFYLRTATDPIETYTDHSHVATLMYNDAIQLIRDTDPSSPVADPDTQPSIDLVTTSNIRRTNGSGEHTHTIRVFYDYKRKTFFVYSISDNLNDSHSAEVATDNKQRHELRMVVSRFGEAVPAAGVRYRTVLTHSFIAARVYARCNGSPSSPVTIDVLCDGTSLTDDNYITLTNADTFGSYVCSRLQAYAVGPTIPITVEVQVVAPGSGASNLEVVVEYYDWASPFDTVPQYP